MSAQLVSVRVARIRHGRSPSGRSTSRASGSLFKTSKTIDTRLWWPYTSFTSRQAIRSRRSSGLAEERARRPKSNGLRLRLITRRSCVRIAPPLQKTPPINAIGGVFLTVSGLELRTCRASVRRLVHQTWRRYRCQPACVQVHSSTLGFGANSAHVLLLTIREGNDCR